MPLPVINAFLAGAAATLLPKNYALLNIVYEYIYAMALLFLSRISLIISFDFDFVQFIQLWIGIPGPPTLAAPLAALSWPSTGLIVADCV